MIQKQEEGGEKYLEVETGPGEDPSELSKDFREAFRRGLPIRAPQEDCPEFEPVCIICGCTRKEILTS